MSASRVKKELSDCQKDEETTGVSASSKGESFEELVGVINGPEDTPYAGGVWHLDITIPEKYPFQPPRMNFSTKIWHPNISSQTGAICLDILKDQWSPALTIKTALLSIQALLSAAEPNDPQDAQVAKMYLDDYETFCGTARFWTESYALPRNDDGDGNDGKVKNLVDMGFSTENVVQALALHNGDESAALEALLSG